MSSPTNVTPQVPNLSGDLSLEALDALFPADPGSFGMPTTAQPGTPSSTPAAPAQPAPPAAPVPTEPFLTAGSTVYKSKEEATHGIQHKDTVIAQLRQKVTELTGTDPLTGRPVGSPVAPGAPVQPAGPTNYTDNRKAYFKDLQAAVERGDEDAYFVAQQKLILDTLAPYAPLLSNVAVQQAESTISREIKEFPEFHRSEQYKAVLEDNPKLRQAIELAESDSRFQADLPDLYKLTYAYSQYKRLPELLQAAAQPPAPSTPAPPARPTMSPASVPAQVVMSGDINTDNQSQMLSTAEGRKAILERGKALGLDKIKW